MQLSVTPVAKQRNHRVRALSWYSTFVVAATALALPYALPTQAQFDEHDGAGTALTKEAAFPGDSLESLQLQKRKKLLARLGVDRWHASGYRGQGVKIAVLDSGFRGYRNYLGKLLPARVQVCSFRTDGNLEAKDSQHGILCAEAIHAIAPEAELLFANWEPSQPDRFLQAVTWARQQGARIISCSVIMPSWSDGEGNGPIHEKLRAILGDGPGPGDILCISSAGNTARRHWSGPFCNQGNGYHEWVPGCTCNELIPWNRKQGSEGFSQRAETDSNSPFIPVRREQKQNAECGMRNAKSCTVECFGSVATPRANVSCSPCVTHRPVTVELCWQPGAVYELSVQDEVSGETVGRSTGHCGVLRCCAIVHFAPRPARVYSVRVRLVEGTSQPFHLVSLGCDLRHTTMHGSIPFPGDGPAVVTVGAVTSSGKRASYSSCGPNSPHPKPDFVAIVPFPSLLRPGSFSGTSAAAPQVAGLAALWWSRYPDALACQVRQALQSHALDLGPPGHDCETGYGLVQLP